uniref:Global nitrogen transcriptional regulator n=1 Tax=Calliarthron tuberculosum TaxID=48942 RepID=M4ITL3_CALTB|nr:global nitrogen transcriptional regulator [Calliarthron tuberculosum]AGA63790.1 global nitrogen transcriptional regulator [Calliarthron tuberculosum]
MTWIKYLEYKNIPFNIYILENNDCIIFHTKSKFNHLMIILDGLIQVLQIFTNGETICTRLLTKDNIIPNFLSQTSNKLTYYYKATAIIKTAIMIVPFNILNKNIKLNNLSIQKLIKLYIYESKNQNTNLMIQIFCHRNTKKRIIYLLLILSKTFGKLKNHEIIIPFYISHNTISMITGSQRVNVTRIMNHLKNNKIISYNKQNLRIYNLLQLIQS